MKATKGPWYESKTGNHQGLIISENTGENIAVSYDKANAKLIAEAPAMFKALEDLDGLFFDILNEFGHKQQILLSTERIAEFAEISAGALARATGKERV